MVKFAEPHAANMTARAITMAALTASDPLDVWWFTFCRFLPACSIRLRPGGSELTLRVEGGWEYKPVAAEQITITRILGLQAEGESLAAIARLLQVTGTSGPSGGRWHDTAVRRIAERAGSRRMTIPPTAPHRRA